MHADERRARRVRVAMFISLSLLMLAPLAMYGSLVFGLVAPAEFSVSVGRLRIATTCFSRKTFCSPHENANPPPDELFVLVNWPGRGYTEDVLITLRLR